MGEYLGADPGGGAHETDDRSRPQRTGLPEYLASLNRVNEGLQLLQKSNLQSSRKAVQQMVCVGSAGLNECSKLIVRCRPDC